MIWKKFATNPFQEISFSKVKICHDFLRSGWNRKNHMKIFENLDLENWDFQKNLFVLAWSHSAFSFSFFSAFKGAWKLRTHALQVFSDQLFWIFKAFFWSHAFSQENQTSFARPMNSRKQWFFLHFQKYCISLKFFVSCLNLMPFVFVSIGKQSAKNFTKLLFV